MTPPVTLQRRGRIGVLTIDNPPVNALSMPVIHGLVSAFDEFDADTSLQALVVHCNGRTFVAGGDISAFDDPTFDAVTLNDVLARFEASQRPVVAALHGTALGGGLEVALACHYRVAVPGSRFGLPEVKIGVLPGSLGTQRLPRLVGVPLALDLIGSGRMIGTADALALGLIDDVRSGDALDAAIAFTLEKLAAPTPLRRLSEMKISADSFPPDAFDKALAAARKKPQYPAHEAIVLNVRNAVDLPFAQASRFEFETFERLRRSVASRGLRHLFFAEREAGKIPGLSKDVVTRSVKKTGVVGAGTMGGGIAMALANAGLSVVIVEANDGALQRGLGLIRSNYEASAAKGKLTATQVVERMALVAGSLDYGSLADCDLVIEAAFEDMALKKRILAKLGEICKAGAVIASNTSTLDVDQLAQASGRPADVVGMHFFSPANVMRLLEVVRGKDTAPDVLATAMAFAKKVGKVAVVSGVCYGFIGNRMAEVYMREAEFLLMEGAEPQQIDKAVEAVGMAMGPCRMLDMAGIDVGAKTVIERGKAGGLPPDPAYRAVCQKLFELGRFGQKTGAGYYRYEGRTPMPDAAVTSLCESLAAEHGLPRRDPRSITDDEIVERLLYPLFNEGVVILEEGIAYRPGDVDVVWAAGYGFPDHRGGPLWMADDIGLPKIVDAMAAYGRQRGNEFGYWTVSPLLAELAQGGHRLSDWKPALADAPEHR